MLPALSSASRAVPTSPLVSAHGLRVSFGAVRALDGVDLELRPGELVALAGENGAGKTTLVRCIAGDIAPDGGEILLQGRPMSADPAAAARRGIAVVWQDLALCDNLDVAANLLLGQESRRLMLSQHRLHVRASELLERLDIPIRDTNRLVSALSGGQRQLVAIARAMSRDPQLLIFDEPTASLGVREAAQVEGLIRSLRETGTTILLACHDLEQMFRLADRIVVLRQGCVVGDLEAASTHPDDVMALLSGQQVDASARRQLTRLHGLADRLVSADPSSSLALILSALGAALGAEQLAIHVVSGAELLLATSLGLAPGQTAAWMQLPFGPAGGPVGRAAAEEQRVIVPDLQLAGAWRALGIGAPVATGASWSVPVAGPSGLCAVITVFMPLPGEPSRDQLDLVSLYAGYAGAAVERERLLEQVTARNRVLETIREMLETLAGPVPVGEGLRIALGSLRRGLQAEEVALVTQADEGTARWRAYAGPAAGDPALASEALAEAARAWVRRPGDGSAHSFGGEHPDALRGLAVVFAAPGGQTVLLATWAHAAATRDETALIEDAAHSLRLALEREEAWLAHQEAAALRRSRELQRGFLSRLSHELRTPLTAIRGYASSLLQPDVTWDLASQQRFLERIAAESARLGRLVDDLLDFSAIESGVMRLQRDWCELPLVVEAAVGCLPAEESAAIAVETSAQLPVIWADHDRLEQVFVNLLGNAIRHNPPGTAVRVDVRPLPGPGWPGDMGQVEITVADDGIGIPADLAASPWEPTRRRSPTAGAGLGLSISKGIVEAHGGRLELVPVRRGTCFRICLPVELNGRGADGRDSDELGLAAPALGGPAGA